MLKLSYKLFATLVLISVFPAVTRAQDCSPPKIVANSKIYNIFSPDQEMILGELTFQRMSGDLRFLRDQELNAYLDRIAQRLVTHLPATGLKFQFYIVDIPEANAFNTPGGYVFVSRKLIGFVNNEDELAGVLAHELGHAVVRHAASDLSELLKKILNVTQVADRKDIADKYNLFLERHRTKSVSRDSGHENEQQLEADRIGLFAMVAAGYDPDAFAAFFDRLAETKGKTGNWFSDIFG
ncbi:MAG TPA: M48 family metalloprotease, partial [Pyrinomonadaceae bacterium]|nr:M48 family metalloprotease [Pyrinomonadaceae bacterium]